MRDCLGFLIANGLACPNIPQRFFTIYKIAFTGGKTAFFEDRLITSDAFGMLGGHPVASGKLADQCFRNDMGEFCFQLHEIGA